MLVRLLFRSRQYFLLKLFTLIELIPGREDALTTKLELCLWHQGHKICRPDHFKESSRAYIRKSPRVRRCSSASASKYNKNSTTAGSHHTEMASAIAVMGSCRIRNLSSQPGEE